MEFSSILERNPSPPRDTPGRYARKKQGQGLRLQPLKSADMRAISTTILSERLKIQNQQAHTRKHSMVTTTRASSDMAPPCTGAKCMLRGVRAFAIVPTRNGEKYARLTNTCWCSWSLVDGVDCGKLDEQHVDHARQKDNSWIILATFRDQGYPSRVP